MKCSVCGSEVPQGGMFCQVCGAIVAETIRVDDSRLREAREEVRKAVLPRASSDYIVKTWWIYLPVALLILSYVAMPIMIYIAMRDLPTSGTAPDSSEFFSDLVSRTLLIIAVTFLFSVISQLFFAWLAFRLVDRQNKHFAREKKLKEAVMKLLRSAAWSDARMRAAYPEIVSIEQAEASRTSTRPNPWTWALLMMLPAVGIVFIFLGFYEIDPALNQVGAALGLFLAGGLVAFVGTIAEIYMFYFLGKDMREHDARWASFAFLSRRGMSKLGFPQGTAYRMAALPDRSFVLYLILTFFFSPFILYWWYTLIKDPNEHFQRQWEFEDHLLAASGQPPIGKGTEELTSVSRH